MAEFKDSIAHTAHGYVHGERAKTYGHPRFDFTAIGKVWTGLLQDVLKEDVVLDAYRVAILMAGLKLCRLVKSPQHQDSRIDTIGYMLTMERLDEPEVPLEDSGHDWESEKKFLDEELRPLVRPKQPSQIKIWMEPGEAYVLNGKTHVNSNGKACWMVFPIWDETELAVSKLQGLGHDDEYGDSYDQELPWQPPGQVQDNWVKDRVDRFWFQHGDRWRRFAGEGPPAFWKEPNLAEMGEEGLVGRRNAERVKQVHSHEISAPCIPGCPVWETENQHRPKFEFTGEEVKTKPFERFSGNQDYPGD